MFPSNLNIPWESGCFWFNHYLLLPVEIATVKKQWQCGHNKEKSWWMMTLCLHWLWYTKIHLPSRQGLVMTSRPVVGRNKHFLHSHWLKLITFTSLHFTLHTKHAIHQIFKYLIHELDTENLTLNIWNPS